jgi:hypothetical protein
MTSRWLIGLLIPVTLVVAWIGISHDPREQTVFLERVADQVERAQTIPPETERAIKDTIASVRWRAASADPQLETRQMRAIERIEAVLSSKEAIHTGAIAKRQLPSGMPGSDE